MLRALLILLLLTTTAMAQQKPSLQPQMTPLDQALGQKLMEEMNSCIQLRAQLIAAQERIKELEAAKPADKK